MKNVLFIVPGYGSVDRGVEVFVKELIQRLDGNAYRVTVLSGPQIKPDDRAECVTRPFVPRERGERWRRSPLRFVLRLFGLTNPLDLEAFTLMVNSVGFLTRRRFDIVLPHGGRWTYRFAWLLCRGANIVSVGHARPTRGEMIFSKHFVALTPFDAERARQKNANIPISVIPNGVDTTRFHPANTREKFTRPTILCVAAFVGGKRHDLLFDAMELLDPDVRLLCVGRGPLRDALMAHPLRHQGRLELMELDHADMPKCYRQAHVFSLASPNETFGLVFLEALASGLPVVANDGPKQRFVLGEAAVYCNVFDRHEYASALRRALASDLATASMAQAKKFSWDSIAHQYKRLFTQLCG